MTMFTHFFCLFLLAPTIKLNFNNYIESGLLEFRVLVLVEDGKPRTQGKTPGGRREPSWNIGWSWHPT